MYVMHIGLHACLYPDSCNMHQLVILNVHLYSKCKVLNESCDSSEPHTMPHQPAALCISQKCSLWQKVQALVQIKLCTT